MEFRRFVSYIYDYLNQVKGQNHGFVKVEIRQNMVRFIIHMDLKGKRPMEYKVYGYVRNGKIPEGIWLAASSSKNGNLDMRFQLNADNLLQGEHGVNHVVTMEEVSGLILVDEENNKYATIWDEEEISIELFRPWQEKSMQRVEENQEFWGHKEQTLKVSNEKETSKEDVEVTDFKEKQLESQEVSEPAVFHRNKSGFQWKRLEESCSYMAPFEEYSEINFLRMEPKHLKYFPKELWYLGRNSFLLHGYYNYRYLIIGKDGGDVIIGVPGTYHPAEERVAALFGFGMFRPAGKCMKLQGAFGYWCKVMKDD